MGTGSESESMFRRELFSLTSEKEGRVARMLASVLRAASSSMSSSSRMSIRATVTCSSSSACWLPSFFCRTLLEKKTLKSRTFYINLTYIFLASCISSKNCDLLFRRRASSLAFCFQWTKLNEFSSLNKTLLTLLTLFWKRLAIWPSFRLVIISLAEWCGDTSSTVFIKRYSFWKLIKKRKSKYLLQQFE